jgi:hypothetical protein
MNVLVAPEPDSVEPLSIILPPSLPALRTAAPSTMKKNVVIDFFIFFHCCPRGPTIQAQKDPFKKLSLTTRDEKEKGSQVNRG